MLNVELIWHMPNSTFNIKKLNSLALTSEQAHKLLTGVQ